MYIYINNIHIVMIFKISIEKWKGVGWFNDEDEEDTEEVEDYGDSQW